LNSFDAPLTLSFFTLFEADAALARGSVLQLELCRFRYLVY